MSESVLVNRAKPADSAMHAAQTEDKQGRTSSRAPLSPTARAGVIAVHRPDNEHSRRASSESMLLTVASQRFVRK
eukprot:6202780-Pleurochrysis_carterae.AAC.1